MLYEDFRNPVFSSPFSDFKPDGIGHWFQTSGGRREERLANEQSAIVEVLSP